MPFICFFIECGNFLREMKKSMKFVADMPDIPSMHAETRDRTERTLHFEKSGEAESEPVTAHLRRRNNHAGSVGRFY